MLDILRKHASSWMIKVILGAIIISFAFFFGYNRMTRAKRSVQGLAPGQPVATVNGVEISDTEFRFFYDRNLDRLKETIKGDQAALNLQKFATNMTLQQLIRRQIMLQTAQSAGIKITDEELASTIKKNPELIHQGEFDPIFYKHQYLPYFENRFGINYEELIRQELSIAALESVFAGIDPAKTPEENAMLFTFEVATISGAEDPEDAASAADSFISQPNDWKALSQRTKAEVKTVGPVTIAERSRILSGRGTFADYEKIFALGQERPVLEKPIAVGDQIFVVKLLKKETSQVKPKNGRTGGFLDDWMREQMKTAKIITHLETE